MGQTSQLDLFSKEYIYYFLNDYQQDFENCFYTEFYLNKKKDLLPHSYFDNTKQISELNNYLVSKGIRDKKRKFNFLLSHFFNALILNTLSSQKWIKLDAYISQHPLAQCLQWKTQNRNEDESPFVLLTLFDKWTPERIEQLKIACQMYFATWLEIIKNARIPIDPILVIENLLHGEFIKQREFNSSSITLPVELSNDIVMTLNNLLTQLKNEHPITQNFIQNKLEILKKLLIENQKLFVAVGDVHGYSECLHNAIHILDKLNLPTYFLGDYIDRGPSSIKTIDLLIEASKKYNNWFFIRGNHENSLLKFIENDQLAEMANLLGKRHSSFEYLNNSDKIKEHYLFLASLPIYIELNNVILLHGGIKDPSITSIEKQKTEDLLWTYGVHKYWSGKKIVRAHEVHAEPKEEHNNIVLDTGLAFGGYLTLAIIEDSNSQKILKSIIKLNKHGLIIDILFHL